MVRHDLEELVGKPSTFSARLSTRCSRTFTGKDISRGGLIEVICLATTRPLPQEVPQSEGQNRDTGDTANYTTNDCPDRSRLRGHNGETR